MRDLGELNSGLSRHYPALRESAPLECSSLRSSAPSDDEQNAALHRLSVTALSERGFLTSLPSLTAYRPKAVL